MLNTIEEYLRGLRVELEGSDAAIVQDALSDAHEHLSMALADVRESGAPGSDAQALAAIIEEFGTPAETAQAYREIERHTRIRPSRAVRPRSGLGAFFGIYMDGRAWSALLYMLIAFETGSLYLVWVLAGSAFSALFALFVFGLPFALAFLLSIRALALLEGRLVEALLGVRMPRRPLVVLEHAKWRAQLKALLVDKDTWRALLYVALHFVLGCAYIVLLTAAIGFSLVLVSVPIVQEVFGLGAVALGGETVFWPRWSYALCVPGGLLLWTIFMHIARGIGDWHGRIAKRLLVRE
jgi:hypothetical protein